MGQRAMSPGQKRFLMVANLVQYNRKPGTKSYLWCLLVDLIKILHEGEPFDSNRKPGTYIYLWCLLPDLIKILHEGEPFESNDRKTTLVRLP